MPAPADSPSTKKSLAEERRRQVRGLLLLALIAIVFSILRAGIHHVFPPNWWRFR